ncbi:hypothetical protein CDL12_05074 [Handroanthus impetiginosus]|uniref:Serine-rich protein-like protein n=1 Tax=Handroanthus impetiginosus TaxID=429701 RepID=A0A2G9HXI6_9LAMI|nr:hypothetical protein CDL12_05074 [Handroanthus impetiginosus]
MFEGKIKKKKKSGSPLMAAPTSGPVLRSISPSRRFNGHYSAYTPSFHSSSVRRPASPTRVNPYNYSSPSFSFPVGGPGSPYRSISVSASVEKSPTDAGPKRTCICSRTNHPGSFRCSLHKTGSSNYRVSGNLSTGLYMRRSAMKNSLVRIGAVEGDLVKRALAALIRPSSHQQRRRGEFRPRPSRLSVVSMA